MTTAHASSEVTAALHGGVPKRTFRSQLRRWWRVEGIGAHLVMILILFMLFIPLIWILATSFKDLTEFSTRPAYLFPKVWSLINYEYGLTSLTRLPIYMRNSFILAFGVVGLRVFVASLAGYAFARMKFRFRDAIFFGIVLSMFIPRAGGLIALYELMSFLKLRNNILGLILLFSGQLPAAIFIMRQYFQAVPQELEDAALIDGANWFHVLWHIALPIASGGMLVVATLTFVHVWSDFLVTFTLVDRDTQMTIAVGIRKLLTLGVAWDVAVTAEVRGRVAGEALDTALLIMAALPVLLFYAAMQRWFIRGLTEGAIKF